jgi:hypothetical protein
MGGHFKGQRKRRMKEKARFTQPCVALLFLFLFNILSGSLMNLFIYFVNTSLLIDIEGVCQSGSQMFLCFFLRPCDFGRVKGFAWYFSSVLVLRSLPDKEDVPQSLPRNNFV